MINCGASASAKLPQVDGIFSRRRFSEFFRLTRSNALTGAAPFISEAEDHMMIERVMEQNSLEDPFAIIGSNDAFVAHLKCCSDDIL